jgi:hypothetical protein
LRKLPRFDDESKLAEQHQPKILLSDVDTHEVSLQGIMSSFSGITFTSKFESALSFTIENLNLDERKVRFRINFQVVDM